MHTPHEQAAIDFCRNPLWDEALWLATSFQWHPSSEMPPVMGLVFADAGKGSAIFRGWVEAVGHADTEDELRVAVLEGDMPGQTPGYTVRLSPSLHEYLDPGDAGYQDVGRAVRMHTKSDLHAPATPDMLGRFKREYEHHGEFMLAPVVPRDGQLYMDVHQGIIKRELVVRPVNEIGPDEPDMRALRSCEEMEQACQAIERLLRSPEGFEQA